MIICGKCHNSNDTDADFCSFCGGGLRSSVPLPQTSPSGSLGYGAAAVATTPQPAISPYAPGPKQAVLNYRQYLDMLCSGQGSLAQLAIRFYYSTGLKSYLVTHHDSFVVPNLQQNAGTIYQRIKQEMDSLGYQELMTSFLYLKTEHIQTLPYLSRSMIRDASGVNRNLNVFGVIIAGLRFLLEIWFGILFLLADLVKLVFKAVSQSIGLAVQTVGRNEEDELLTERRLILASTYRNTRTYTYVRDVGPETYIGWFTHHEPLPGTGGVLALILLFLGFAILLATQSSLPLVIIIGAVAGIAYTLWLAPWMLSKLGALPRPRYISGVVQALGIILMLFSMGSMRSFALLEVLISLPLMLGGGNFLSFFIGSSLFSRSLSFSYSQDPFMMVLVFAQMIALNMLFLVSLIVFLRTITMGVSHFDQFDAETHAQILKARVAHILGESLMAVGYSATEVSNILAQNIPGAGRYRRARN